MLNKDRHALKGILESIKKIEDFTTGYLTADAFYNDELHFDAVMMNFIIIGEFAVKSSERLKEDNPDINWLKIKGLRNIVAHDYFGVDAEEIWQIIKNDLPKLKSIIINILK